MTATALSEKTTDFFNKIECEELPTNDISKTIQLILNARHYSSIVIDIDAFPDNSEEEIQNALILIASMNTSFILIMALGKSIDDDLIRKLIDGGLNYIITSLQPEIVQSSVNRFMSRELTPVNFTESNSAPDKKKIKTATIGIAGILPRIGTTTQAIRICRYLSNTNRSCYIESNKSGHLRTISEVFNCELSDRCINFQELSLFYEDNSSENEFEYKIIDYGTDVLKASNCDKCIIVAGMAAWEINALANQMHTLTAENIYFVFSFISENDKNDLLDFMAEQWQHTCFADYTPDMFSPLSDKEKNEYRKIFTEKSENKLWKKFRRVAI